MYLIFLYSFILLQSVICLFKSFVLFLKTIFSFIIIYTLFLISFKRIHMFKHTVSNLEFFYVLICLYCISIIIFWPGAIVFFKCKVGMAWSNSKALYLCCAYSPMAEAWSLPVLPVIFTAPATGTQQDFVAMKELVELCSQTTFKCRTLPKKQRTYYQNEPGSFHFLKEAKQLLWLVLSQKTSS